MSVQNRRKYDPDFKRNAVLLSEEEGRTVTEVAKNLGISKENLQLIMKLTGGIKEKWLN